MNHVNASEKTASEVQFQTPFLIGPSFTTPVQMPDVGNCINTTAVSQTVRSAQKASMDRILRLFTLLIAIVAPLAAALKFDLHPVSSHDAAKYERCIRNFVAKDQLVVVTAILDGYRGDGQKVDMHVRTRAVSRDASRQAFALSTC